MVVTLAQQWCVRLSIQNTPHLWTRIETDFYGYHILIASQPQQMPVLPPIPFFMARQNAAKNLRHMAWARTYAEMLASSSASPLVDGKWFLGQEPRWQELEPSLLQKIVAQQSHGFVQWEFSKWLYPVALRRFSSPEHGRVQAWRKFTKTDSLPPILLYWVSALDAYVILDGHDRLLAAHLEQVSAPALVLHETRLWTADSTVQNKILAGLENAAPPKGERFSAVDRANRVLQQAFSPEVHMVGTRARMLEGGMMQWTTEVKAELKKQHLVDSRMLDDL
jgi:hypothetical protein